jgi:hypothetical protein
MRLRRIGLHHTPFAKATWGTIRLKLLKIGALLRVSVRRRSLQVASGLHRSKTWVVALSSPRIGNQLGAAQFRAPKATTRALLARPCTREPSIQERTPINRVGGVSPGDGEVRR